MRPSTSSRLIDVRRLPSGSFSFEWTRTDLVSEPAGPVLFAQSQTITVRKKVSWSEVCQITEAQFAALNCEFEKEGGALPFLLVEKALRPN